MKKNLTFTISHFKKIFYIILVGIIYSCCVINGFAQGVLAPPTHHIVGSKSLCDPDNNYSLVPHPTTVYVNWVVTDYLSGAVTTWTTLGGSFVAPAFGSSGGSISVSSSVCTEPAVIEITPCCVNKLEELFIVKSDELLSNPGVLSGLMSHQRILVEGDFTIDVPNLILNNYEFHMESGSKIILGHGINLKLSHCTFETCFNMWRGIYLADDYASLTAYNGCVFKDAERAVYAVKWSSDFFITDCDFVDNIIGICTTVDPPASSSEGNFSVKGCNFNFNGTLKLPYFNQLAFGTHPMAGIYLRDRHGIIGDNKNNPNTFRDLNNGIWLQNSGIRIFNSNFENIRNEGFYSFDFMGSAIYADDKGAAINELYVNGTHFYGGLSVPLVNMKDCDYGVYTLDAQNIINTSKMENVDIGILVKGIKTSKKSFLELNVIEANTAGIYFLLNPGASKLLAAHNSIFTLNTKAKCIRAEQAASWGNVLLEITDNHLVDIGKGGIDVSFFKLPLVKDNVINTNGFINPDFTGISMNYCNQASVACNNINGGGKNDANVNNHGLRFNTTSESFMDCNTVDNTTKGIGFYGGCGSTKMRDNAIWNHNIGLFVHTTGVLGYQPFNGNRWEGTFTNPDFGAEDNNASAGQGNEKFDVNTNNGNNNEYLPTLSPLTPVNWFTDVNGPANYSCTEEICDPKKNQSNTNQNYSVELAIANGTYTTSEFIAESQDLARQYLFDKLANDAALRAQFGSFQSFYSAHQNTNIEILQNAKAGIESITQYSSYYTLAIKTADSILTHLNDSLLLLDSLRSVSTGIDSLIDTTASKIRAQIKSVQNLVMQVNAYQEAQNTGKINTALFDNSLVQSSKLVEQNEKLINTIYLETIAQGIYELNANQAASVLSIAEQCPYSGGSAVYRARVLYQLVDKNMEYNDFSTCLAQGYFRKSHPENSQINDSTSELVKFGISPNPAKNEATVYYENKFKEVSFLEICNLSGKKIDSFELPQDGTTVKLNTSFYENGVYLVKILSSKAISNALKLVVLK